VWGEASGGQVDVDLDDDVAAEVAKQFLLETGLVFGRGDRLQTHRIYRTSSPIKSLKLLNPKGGRPILEIRSDRLQTIAPGSYHPKDRLKVEWCFRTDPACVRPENLYRDCYTTAAVTLLIHAWPAEGTRHAAALALAGGLKSLGLAEEEAEKIVRVIVEEAGDDEPDNRLDAVYTTYRRPGDEPTQGWPKLETLMDKECVRQAKQWLREARRLQGGGQDGNDNDANDNDGLILDSSSIAEVKTMSMKWLWPNVIPAGCLMLVEGDPAAGKSVFLLDLAARVSSGRAMPDGTATEKGYVLLWNQEDNEATVIKPRLQVAGLNKEDEENVRTPKHIVLPRDTGKLANTIKKLSVRLVIVDPLANYLDPKTNLNDDLSVRQALMPLADVAAETGTVILLVRHMKKHRDQTTTRMNVGLGSIGFNGVARYSIQISRQKQSDLREISVVKNNLGPDTEDKLLYRIHSVPLILDDGKVGSVAKVEWVKSTLGTITKEAKDGRLFEFLRRNPGATQDAIGEALNLSKGEVSKTLKAVAPLLEVCDETKPYRYSLKTAAVVS
jgi:archaellum biogenesis ATPase FlaH